jgi:hypothetical protein
MATVFLLHHEHEQCGRDEVKLIGVYSTQADAEAAISRLRNQNGFRDWPEGFTIDPYRVGVDHWIDGFVTVAHILILPRSAAGGFQVAASVWRPGDLYEITDIDDPREAKFGVGQVVRCEEQAVAGHGESVLVATQVVQEKA